MPLRGGRAKVLSFTMALQRRGPVNPWFQASGRHTNLGAIARGRQQGAFLVSFCFLLFRVVLQGCNFEDTFGCPPLRSQSEATFGQLSSSFRATFRKLLNSFQTIFGQLLNSPHVIPKKIPNSCWSISGKLF